MCDFQDLRVTQNFWYELWLTDGELAGCYASSGLSGACVPVRRQRPCYKVIVPPD